MNILVIGKFYTEAFALHIAETLASMGHAVRRFDPGLRSRRASSVWHRVNQVRGMFHAAADKLPAIRARRMRRLWNVAQAGPLDVVIVCHDFLLPGEVAELRRRSGAQIALWFPDSLANFGQGFFLNAPYDAAFFKDPFILHRLEGTVRFPVHYLPECFNPERHRRPRHAASYDKWSCDVCTAGNMHAWRVLVFSHLSEFHVKMWGLPAPVWMPMHLVPSMYQGSPVYDEAKASAFLGAKIVVNSLHYSEMWGVNVRTFEAAGIGAFQLVDWRPGLSQLFDDGRELVAFRGMDDLKRKIRYWLPRADERQRIAGAGMQRAHQEHTYRHRLALLLATLEGKAGGFPLPALHEHC